MKPSHLYFHVPFCLRRCSYCDFAVTVDRSPPVASWVACVRTELERHMSAAGWDGPLAPRSVYLGGGTPSLLGGDGMETLRRGTEDLIRWSAVEDWTAEANPESFDADLGRAWRETGVNRLSLGAQTFHEPSLRWMGRLHGPEGPGRAVDAARAAGIDNVSVDLIFGLPARLGRDWSEDLSRTLALQPEHVSLYGLTAEPRTPLARWVREGREHLPEEERYEEEYLEAASRLTAAGFLHYEVSNFGLPGRESVHNGAYWTGAAYLGLGPSAHSYVPPFRWWNTRDWMAYRAAVEAGADPTEERERIEGAAARLERVWLGLRTSRGMSAGELGDAGRACVESWVPQGWAEVEDGQVRLTARGWLLLDRLAVELDHALDATSEHGTHSAPTRRSAPPAMDGPVMKQC